MRLLVPKLLCITNHLPLYTRHNLCICGFSVTRITVMIPRCLHTSALRSIIYIYLHSKFSIFTLNFPLLPYSRLLVSTQILTFATTLFVQSPHQPSPATCLHPPPLPSRSSHTRHHHIYKLIPSASPISFTPSTSTSTMPPTAPHTQPLTLALLPRPQYRHSLSCPVTIACRRHTPRRQRSVARSGHAECMPRGQHTGVVSGYGAHDGEDQKLIAMHTYDWSTLVR